MCYQKTLVGKVDGFLENEGFPKNFWCNFESEYYILELLIGEMKDLRSGHCNNVSVAKTFLLWWSQNNQYLGL